MTSTEEPNRPLYVMAKPAGDILAELKCLRAMLGIESRYAPDRLHSTLLPLGQSRRETIEAACRILGSFHADPFPVTFDHIDGNTLKRRKGLRAPADFQRALVRHFAVSGFAPPPYKFDLHLNLDYRIVSDRRVSIPPLSWRVEEILLIESVHGEGRHIPHGRFPLFVRQYALAL